MEWQRFFAGLIDAAIVLGWAGTLGVGFYLAGWLDNGGGLTVFQVHLILAGATAFPVLIAFAILESGSKQGTVGKRIFKLRVHGTEGISAVSFPRAIVRNLLKLAVPFFILHMAIVAGITGGLSLISGIAISIPLILVLSYVVSIFVGQKRTLYDFAVATTVTDRAYRAFTADDLSDIIESVPRRAMN